MTTLDEWMETPAWVALAACKGSTSIMYPDPTEHGQQELEAKKVCWGCPVRADCILHAVTHREPYGIWGGLTETERLDIASFNRGKLHGRGKAHALNESATQAARGLQEAKRFSEGRVRNRRSSGPVLRAEGA